MTQNVSDKTILELWRSPQFSASYRGIRTFKRVLFTDLNIDISEKRLYNILKTDPIYLMHIRKPTNFKRRSLSVNNYGELVQAIIVYNAKTNLVKNSFNQNISTKIQRDSLNFQHKKIGFQLEKNS
jgi:hypothetical protein